MNRKMIGRYIVTDTEICHGKPTFRGTHIMVWQVLEQVANGKHPDLDTKAKRMGKVIRLSHPGLMIWELHAEDRVQLVW